MAELISMTYEQARAEHFKELMKKEQRKINWWQYKAHNALGPVSMLSRSHIECSEAGMRYSYYNDALEALEDNRFQYETGFVKGFESAQPKWISVEERLPGDPDDVVGEVVEILIEKGGDILCVAAGFYDHEEKHWVIYDGLYTPDVLDGCYGVVRKWKSLPEPPKEV